MRVHEGCGSCSVCECMCVSVSALAATYLFYMLKTICHHGSFEICIVWILLKMLCSKILATFADHRCLLRFLLSFQLIKETATSSFQEDVCSSDNSYIT